MIPKIKDIEIPLLKLLADNSPLTWDECTDILSTHFTLTDNERNQLMPDGRNIMKFRVGWAKANLKRSGYVEAPTRGIYSITPKGLGYFNLTYNKTK